MWKASPRKQKGFTLVELTIIVAIIGILATIALPQFQLYRAKSFMATVRCDTKNAQTAVQSWVVGNPGGSPPEVLYTGPAVMTEYPPARVSPFVTIHITPTGDVTGSDEDLHGTYTIRADGSVVDSLPN